MSRPAYRVFNAPAVAHSARGYSNRPRMLKAHRLGKAPEAAQSALCAWA